MTLLVWRDLPAKNWQVGEWIVMLSLLVPILAELLRSKENLFYQRDIAEISIFVY
ncbi:MAG: hypothetical protein RQ732_02465 [Methylophaga sp.]|nr:hypothetical protein [Methylophaga sp.]